MKLTTVTKLIACSAITVLSTQIVHAMKVTQASLLEEARKSVHKNDYAIQSGNNIVALSEEAMQLSPVLQQAFVFGGRESQTRTYKLSEQLSQNALNLLAALLYQEAQMRSSFKQWAQHYKETKGHKRQSRQEADHTVAKWNAPSELFFHLQQISTTYLSMDNSVIADLQQLYDLSNRWQLNATKDTFRKLCHQNLNWNNTECLRTIFTYPAEKQKEAVSDCLPFSWYQTFNNPSHFLPLLIVLSRFNKQERSCCCHENHALFSQENILSFLAHYPYIDPLLNHPKIYKTLRKSRDELLSFYAADYGRIDSSDKFAQLTTDLVIVGNSKGLQLWNFSTGEKTHVARTDVLPAWTVDDEQNTCIEAIYCVSPQKVAVLQNPDQLHLWSEHYMNVTIFNVETKKVEKIFKVSKDSRFNFSSPGYITVHKIRPGSNEVTIISIGDTTAKQITRVLDLSSCETPIALSCNTILGCIQRRKADHETLAFIDLENGQTKHIFELAPNEELGDWFKIDTDRIVFQTIYRTATNKQMTRLHVLNLQTQNVESSFELGKYTAQNITDFKCVNNRFFVFLNPGITIVDRQSNTVYRLTNRFGLENKIIKIDRNEIWVKYTENLWRIRLLEDYSFPSIFNAIRMLRKNEIAAIKAESKQDQQELLSIEMALELLDDEPENSSVNFKSAEDAANPMFC